jgi:hypothetical protein
MLQENRIPKTACRLQKLSDDKLGHRNPEMVENSSSEPRNWLRGRSLCGVREECYIKNGMNIFHSE